MDKINFSEYLPYALFVSGLILTIIACFFGSKKSKLKANGIAVEGIVFEQSSNDADFNVNNKITIRFLTKKQEWITAPIDQPFQLFYTGQYKDGEVLKVYYSPNSPSEFYVDRKQSELTTRITVGVTGFGIMVVGLYKMFA